MGSSITSVTRANAHLVPRPKIASYQISAKSPKGYQQRATFYTDRYEVYKGVIPPAQHKAMTKPARKTDHVERFHNTLIQRVSRLLRDTLSCSKKLANHVGAIRFFPRKNYISMSSDL
jgi:insertion element IS1 protein InsB